jgi:hypothetical protein
LISSRKDNKKRNKERMKEYFFSFPGFFSYLCKRNAITYGCKTNIKLPETADGQQQPRVVLGQ